MPRVQLALNVDDVDEAVDFYAKLFGAQPAKRRPGYANFALDEPALKLVLLENPGSGGTLNHLGVEVATPGEVAQATQRLGGEGFATEVENESTCCYAVQDKVWVTAPGGERWEVYTVLADARPDLEGATTAEAGAGGTCSCATSPEADGAEAVCC